MSPIGILHIDIEGGFGGSSRSLYELVSRLDRNRVRPVVVHKLSGPVSGWYDAQNIRCVHLPDLAQFVPRKRNSWKIFLVKIPEFMHLVRVVRALRRIIIDNRISVVHLNYEGLWLIAWLLHFDRRIVLISHCRTLLPENAWSRFLVAVLERSLDYVFYISPNEERAFLTHARRSVSGSVLWNIARSVTAQPPETRWASRRIVVLSNVDYEKGIDRCLDVGVDRDRVADQADQAVTAIIDIAEVHVSVRHVDVRADALADKLREGIRDGSVRS